ncbi:MAG: hypothetical protein P4L53_00740 [Candidatus Obscuribacterales bacterium]|nr:hypothetical protein [Candidatus Obscuribacterales bacterium]
MFVHKFKTPLAVIALLAACVGGPAKADYLINVVHNVLDTNGRIVQGTVAANGDIIAPNGRVIGRAAIGVLNPNGVIVDTRGNTVTRIYDPGISSTTVVTSSAPPAIFTDTLGAILDNRRLELERMIKASYQSGAISKFQEGDYRTSLDRIQTAENNSRASGGVLTYDEALDVARDLDSLAANVSASSRLSPMSPLIVVDASGATRFAVAPSGYFSTTYTTAATVPKTTQTTVTNTLTPDGTTVVKTTETKYGGTSVVVNSTDLVTSLESRRDAINNMLNDGLSNGKLSPNQVAELRNELDSITRDEMVYKSSDGMMTADEAVIIGARLDELNNRIATTMSIRPLSSIIVLEGGSRRVVLHPINTYSFSSSPSIVQQTTTTTSSPDTLMANSGTTTVVTTSPAGSSVVTVRTITPQVYVTTLETRRETLRKLIEESREKKVMDRARADAMLAELERIHTQTVPTITYGRAVLLARDLDMVGGEVLVLVPTLNIPQPIIQGSHLTIANGQIAEMDDVSARRSDLEGRITKDYLQGRLTSSQAERLRDKMNSIDVMEAEFRRPDGDLSLKESRILYTNYDKVASDLDKEAGKENR